MSELYIAITVSNGSVYHMAFQTEVRTATGVLQRSGTDIEIQAEIERASIPWARRPDDPVTVVSWRRLNDTNRALFNTDREYRNALVDNNGTIQHDMGRARLIHLARLRIARDSRFPQLDADWMRAMGQRRAAEADAIEVQRQALRDAPQTWASAINAAQSVAELRAIVLPE